jgi:MFS family permease
MLVLSQVLNGFTFGYFGIFIAAYLVQSGMSAFVVGLLLAVEGTVSVLAAIPLAMRSDRKGRKGNVILGNAILAPVVLVFGLTRNIAIFAMAAAVAGIAEAMAISSWNAMIADLTEPGRSRDSAFSLFFIAGASSSSLGAALPFAFPAIEASVGLSSAAVHVNSMILLGLANFATPVILWVLLRDYHEQPRPAQGGLRLAGMRQSLKFSVCNSIIGLGAGLIIPLVATWLLLKFGVPDSYSGPYLAISGLTIAFAAVASPRLARKLGLFPAILTTQVSSTAFMISMAFIPNVYLAGGVYLVRAALMNMNQPLMDSFLMGITPPERRGLASTLNVIIWRVPNLGSTLLGGYLLSSAAYSLPTLGLTHLDLPWVLASMLYVAGAALLFTNFRNVKPTQ